MSYSKTTKPGLGDPYWYEWSVGELYLVDMINPDNHIRSVELQGNASLGLDDVIVICLQNKSAMNFLGLPQKYLLMIIEFLLLQ